jgi:hypothetical protein
METSKDNRHMEIMEYIRKSEAKLDREEAIRLSSKKAIRAEMASCEMHAEHLLSKHSLAETAPIKMPGFPVVPDVPYHHYVLRVGFDQRFGLNFDNYVKDWRVVVDPYDTYPGDLLVRQNNSAKNWMIVFVSLFQVGEGRTMILYQQSRGNKLNLMRVILDVVVEANRTNLEMIDMKTGLVVPYTMREWLG